jgi:hypothetical protein
LRSYVLANQKHDMQPLVEASSAEWPILATFLERTS